MGLFPAAQPYALNSAQRIDGDSPEPSSDICFRLKLNISKLGYFYLFKMIRS